MGVNTEGIYSCMNNQILRGPQCSAPIKQLARFGWSCSSFGIGLGKPSARKRPCGAPKIETVRVKGSPLGTISKCKKRRFITIGQSRVRAMILSAGNRQLSLLHFHPSSNFLESASAHRENVPPCAAQ